MKKLKILYLAPEVSPFAKTGGLADVASDFPGSLKDMGHEVRVIMPKYKVINERRYILREVIRLKEIPVQLGKDVVPINVKSAFIPDSKVQIYFIDYKPFFGREGLYNDPRSGNPYKDNHKRFLLFAKGVLETLKLLQWQPDIIHCNDWQSSLVPLLLKTNYRDDPFFKSVTSLLTIHNISEQGHFDRSASTILTPYLDGFDVKNFELKGKINYLKIGILLSDGVNTVSEQHVKEILTPQTGFGLDKILKKHKPKISGILNGVNYNKWNPEKDKYIPVQYSVKNLDKKLENKQELLKKVRLPFDESVLTVGVISRLIEQKGIDILLKSLPKLKKLNLQMIILGSGDKKYHTALKAAQKKNSKWLNVQIGYNEEFAHLIKAGSDVVLIPSKIEPCGLIQLYSLRYGTVPIVYNTGGLAETITEFNQRSGKGNGLVFKDYTPQGLSTVLVRAQQLFANKSQWKLLQRNGMKEDHSWKNSAKKYSVLYLQMYKEKRQ